MGATFRWQVLKQSANAKVGYERAVIVRRTTTGTLESVGAIAMLPSC